MKLSNRWVKNQSTRWRLLITFRCLTSLVALPVSQSRSVLNRSCNSGQCISAVEKVKNNVGAPTLVIIAFRSSRTLFQ